MQQYTRIIMPLTNETKGYEYKGRKPAGRCLLESRAGLGKLMLWVQDLKPETLYHVHMIFKSGGGLKLCSLTVNEKGRGELSHSFNTESLEDCAAVAVIASGTKTSAPLCGYREGSFPWRNSYNLIKEEPPPKEEAPEEKEEIPEEEEEEETPYEPLPPDPENTLTDAFKKEVEGLLKSHTRMQPFQKQSRDVIWVRISLDEDLSLPNYICDLLSDPFVEEAYNQYSHLILGKAVDAGPTRYYIGVPALYEATDKIVGFRQFKGSGDAEPTAGDYGYWLIFMS